MEHRPTENGTDDEAGSEVGTGAGGAEGGGRGDEAGSTAEARPGAGATATVTEAGAGAATPDPLSDTDDPVTDPPSDGAPPPRSRSRLRRWGRRIALTCVVTLVAVTLASFTYNAFTDDRADPPEGLTYVQAADIRTRYQTWGTSGSPVVLVHGAFESVDTWSRLAPLLARNHRVYAFDLTGYGYSQRRGPYTVDHLTRQLLGFLDAMHLGGPGERPLLVGHSSGAAMVAEAALRAPERIGGMMLLDGDALDTGAGPPSALEYVLIDPFRTSLLRIGLGTDWLIRKVYGSQCGPECPRLDGAGVDQWRRPFQVAGAEGALWSMLGEGVLGISADRLQRLRDVPMPKSVVFGANDDVFDRKTPTDTADRIGAPPPTLIPRSRHLPMISAPEAVADAIDAVPARR
ncbi:alpha/beta fold hydrolase [Embleya hyalina]|uniref:Alpha/beta hydrolase n=1 Tax=Embleya hyalina TaxID=516124 RepID=A0A401YQF3_9ACTN|nr:alpha/beta hydrolase [Embleya hyalina]GCD96807.1 alpha/beta hydrolase [Embleya hyalina]